jgi:hypothetical protein
MFTECILHQLQHQLGHTLFGCCFTIQKQFNAHDKK